MALNDVERDLCMLINQARRFPSDELEPCKDWTKEELARAKKMYQKIDQLQGSPKISSKLFNEARDCCDLLQQYMKRLEDNIVQASTCRSFNSLTDLGTANKYMY